jgi:putative flippase GtrA
VQCFRYVFVDGLSVLIDLVFFLALLWLGAPAMVALVVGLFLSAFANLFAFVNACLHQRTLPTIGKGDALLDGGSRRVVAHRNAGSYPVGLGPTEVAAKIIATRIVLIWHYLGRLFLVFFAQMPIATWRLLVSAIDRVWARL